MVFESLCNAYLCFFLNLTQIPLENLFFRWGLGLREYRLEGFKQKN